MKFRSVHLALLCGLLLLLLPGTTQAQADAITWQIVPGFDGSYKSGAWFPLTITVANSGPDIRGTIALRFRTGQAATYSQSLDLPRNAKKRIVLPVASDSNQDGSMTADVTLRNGETVVRSDKIELNALNTSQLVLGVVSDEGNVLPELSNTKNVNRTTTLLRLTSATLPDRAELLQSFDALFLHAVDTSAWTGAQRSALETWSNNGGQLVVGGDTRVTSGLTDLLPATVAESNATSTLRGLSAKTGWTTRNNSPAVRLMQLTPKPGADVIATGDDGQPLLVRRATGAGSISVAAFGLETLRDSGDPADFWPRVLPLDNQIAPWQQLRDQGFGTLQQALKLPALRLPSILGFLGFLLLYIVTIGPLNYLVLRRFDRREWAYVTIPLGVVLFSMGAYAYGTLGRGQSAIVSQLSIVRVGQNRTQGEAMSYLALFSPQRRAYDLRFAPDVLAADLEPPWQRQGRALDVLYAEDSVRFPDLLVDVGGVRAFAVQSVVAAPALEATVGGTSNKPQVTLRNRSDQRLTDVLIVRGDGRVQQVGTLEPGAEQTIAFAPDRFLQEGGIAAAGTIIERQTVLNQLSNVLTPSFAHNGPVVEQPGVNGVVQAVPPTPPTPTDQAAQPDPLTSLQVLGWQDQGSLRLSLDGRAMTGSGESLYIWPVTKE